MLSGSQKLELEAAVSSYREAIKCNRKTTSSWSITHLGVLIKQGYVVAQAADFPDGKIPVTRDEQAAKLYREAIANDRNVAAIFNLGCLMERGSVKAVPEDFSDKEIPSKPAELAAKLYREAIKRGGSMAAKFILGLVSLIEKREIAAESADFTDGNVPESHEQQVIKLLTQYGLPIPARLKVKLSESVRQEAAGLLSQFSTIFPGAKRERVTELTPDRPSQRNRH